MSEASSRARLLARATAELLVIILGVVIGLAVDRWVSSADDRAQADRWTQQLLADLASDSLELVRARDGFREEGQEGLSLLQFIEDGSSTVEDPTGFVDFLEHVGWWVPFNFAASTWGEVLATGKLGIFEPDVRAALTTYYESTEWYSQLESTWAPVFEEYWIREQAVVPPLSRIAALDRSFGMPSEREVTTAGAAAVLTAFRTDPALLGALGQVVSVYRYGEGPLENLLRDLTRAMGALATP